MHLILLLNVNTELAVHPADETLLITLPSPSPSREPAPWAPGGRSAAAGWSRSALGSFSLEADLEATGNFSPRLHLRSGLFFDAPFIPLNVRASKDQEHPGK